MKDLNNGNTASRKKKNPSKVNKPAKQYECTEAETASIAALKAHADETPSYPRLVYRDGNLHFDHEDDWIGVQLMINACGASDVDAFTGLLNHLVRFCTGEPDEIQRQVNSLVASVAEVQPRDQVEMMLAAQMVVAHELSMKLGRQVANSKTIEQQDSAERGFNKVARTYTTQMEALRKHRNGGQQKVTVEHVTVNSGGQAIVGAVETGVGGDRSER